jgi:1,4-dihydroxy-2-naphthoyl-CoA synthase
MTETLVEYDCRDQIATLTLNRPDRLNAFSDDLVRHLMDALRRFDLDPEAEVAIICGKGRRFRAAPTCISVNCAGARNSRSMAGRKAGAPTPPIY